MDQSPPKLTWYKSSLSGANNDDCVEVADLLGGGRAVRDSKDPGGPTLTFTVDGWRAFVDATKNGEFD